MTLAELWELDENIMQITAFDFSLLFERVRNFEAVMSGGEIFNRAFEALIDQLTKINKYSYPRSRGNELLFLTVYRADTDISFEELYGLIAKMERCYVDSDYVSLCALSSRCIELLKKLHENQTGSFTSPIFFK